MELTNKGVIKELLRKYNAKPEKYLGQHFILSKSVLQKMIDETEIPRPFSKGRELIIEIGSGLGTLTRELAKTGAKIIAVEKDPMMVSILKETLIGYKNVKIIQADARSFYKHNLSTFYPTSDVGFLENKYKVIANLPYNIATFLIRSWLEIKNPPKMMVLMIQKEVAQRMVANPPHSNLLAISIQFYANAKIVSFVPKEMFWPRPKVDAAIIKITPNNIYLRSQVNVVTKEKIDETTIKNFFSIVKAGFSQPRKQLAGNMSKKLGISKEKIVLIFRNLSISEQVRAENLSLDEWLKIATQLIPVEKL